MCKKLILFLTLVSIVFSWKPLFAGHRGSYKGVANTVESYTNGIEIYGYTGLECDVRVTKDKKYVISHDESIKGNKGEMVITSTTLEELKTNLITQTRGGITYTGYICTMEEYLRICKNKKAFPIIELKWTDGINSNDMSNFPGLVTLIKSYELESKVIFLTSMYKSLEYIRTKYPTFKCQYLMYTLSDERFEWSKKWKVNPSIEVGGFTIEDVEKVRKVGLEVATWCVNSKADYLKYAKMGVYMMTCDYLYPSEMAEVEEP